jgi:hypothetical protein
LFLLGIHNFKLTSFQRQVPNWPFWVLVADITVVGCDIKWDPAFEHSLADLSRKILDDSSSLDYKC